MMTWTEALASEKATPYFRELMLHVQAEREAGKVIYPPKEDVFNAFAMTALEDIRVVILGQDPYHRPHQAHGLCFSVLPGVKIPPSLRNIYKELADDIDGFSIPNHGTLSPWAEQGVLLLNTVLTVEQGKAHSHAKLGWETFTDKVIEVVNQHCSNVVFLLWGSHAQKKGNTINREKHHVLHAPHPSPLSAHRGFFGSKPFSQTNHLLTESGKAPIQWQV